MAKADLQPVELQFNSKWIGNIWHTQRKEPETSEQKNFLRVSVLSLRCSVRQRSRALATEIVEFWSAKHIDGSCAAQWSQGRNRTASETVLREDQELGTPGLVIFLFYCALSCLISFCFSKLKAVVLVWHVIVFKQDVFFLVFSSQIRPQIACDKARPGNTQP